MSIAIMVFLFMVGVGSYWRMTRGYALRAGVSTLESTLHAARALAVHERSPADLMVIERQVDPPPALPQVERIYVVGKRTVSCWHFEEAQLAGTTRFSGALGQEGLVVGQRNTVPGRIGRALALNGSTHVLVDPSPYLNGIRDGVFVEAFVWPKPAGQTSGARLVIASQTAFSLALLCSQPSGGLPVFSLTGSVTTTAPQTLSAQTYAIIPAGEWTHVALTYAADGKDLAGNPQGVVLLVNGQEVDRLEVVAGNGQIAANTGPLDIGGDPSHCFIGYLDELKIAALVKGEVQSLPKNTVVTRQGATALTSQDAVPARAVRFDDEGKLDVTGTTAKARFYVDSPGDNLFRVVQVGRLGRIEVLSKLNKDSLDREVQ